jgi:iron-chelate-transporting ATPase
MVLHDPNMAARYCDGLIALKGRQTADARHARRDHAGRRAQRHFRRRDGVFPHPVTGQPIGYVQ